MRNIQGSDILMHRFEETRQIAPKRLIVFAVVVVIAGIFSGYGLTYIARRNTSMATSSPDKTSSKKTVIGSADTKTFRDQAEGRLEVGGIDGEGTHKLIRSGGDSQTVYLTSSILDLNEFVGKKVRVWGETHAGKKAGWLMDVGRVETLE